jgi:regulator of sigma E protease
MSWLLVFLGFSALIILHEAGHFLAAKATGMRAERFFLFFGPRLVSIRRGETEYGIATIPLGGYVKISGMSPEEKLPPEVEPRAYHRQPVWKRIVVTAAGPAVNIALAFAILFVAAFGLPQPTAVIRSIEPGSPAAASQLRPGDRIVAVDGRSFRDASTSDRLERFRRLIAAHRCPAPKPADGCRAANPVTLLVRSGDRLHSVTAYPTYDASLGRTRIGFEYRTTAANPSPLEAVSFAGRQMWFVTSGTFQAVTHLFEPQQRGQISGIVGISDVGHQAIEAGTTQALLLLALVSLSLGLLNLLPFLPLDGGHIFWSLVEKLRGRPTPLRVMEGASVIGIVLVGMLMFIGLSNDIGRLSGEGFNVR